jgi:hypothetical protein
MLLYHYTAKEYLANILAQGLTTGEVPVTWNDVLNGVWLTNDPDPAEHGLCDARDLTPEERRLAGVPDGKPARFPNKRAVRITVMIPSTDRNLTPWPSWAKRRLTPEWYATLDRVGGGKSKTWFVYWDVIPPSHFREVLDLTAATPVAAT